jgi:hypothetical protein
MFRALVDESGHKDELYAAAHGKPTAERKDSYEESRL